jgi:hypothetical protein
MSDKLIDAQGHDPEKPVVIVRHGASRNGVLDHWCDCAECPALPEKNG